MRTFNFRARNIGEEKYLSYTMGEDCELDEDVLGLLSMDLILLPDALQDSQDTPAG